MGSVCNSKQLKSSNQSTQLSMSFTIQKANENIKTQGSLDESFQSYLNIGQDIQNLGNIRKDVQEVLDEHGTFHLISQLDSNDQQFVFVSYPDGSIYQGQLVNGKRQGIGRQHWVKEGNYLEGIWANDKANGPARMIYPNGDIFEGQLIDSKAHGFGIFRNKKKVVKGYWIDNKLSGNGVEVRKNGIKYEGTFQDGVIEGRGQFIFPDGRKYVGQVSKGQIHGEGVMMWPDLSYYKGGFKNNSLKGYGCYTDVDSQVYIGYFISLYQPDIKRLEIFFSKDHDIENKNKLIKFKKQYGLN